MSNNILAGPALKPKHIYTDFPLYIFMLAIFLFSTISNKSLISTFGVYDKVYHVSLFFILAYCFYRFLAFRNFDINVIMISVVLGTTLYGLIDEVHQLFVLNRSFDLYDLLADAIGALLAALTGRFIFSVDQRLYTALLKLNAPK